MPFGLGNVFGGLSDSGVGGITSGLGHAIRALEGPKRPTLKPVSPPRGPTARSREPFDFFGTLFTTPATAELNPMVLLNQTV